MDQEIEETLIQIQSTTVQINSCNSAILVVKTSIIGLELHQLEFCSSSSNGISWKKVDFSFYHISAAVKLCLGDLLVMGSNPETVSLHMQG